MTRRVVTIVFADLVGSTALHERLDAESARLFMERYYRAMRGAVEAHGGTVTQLLGDGVKAVFGAPRVAEDDAIRAVRAAVEMQRAFRELADAQSSAVGKTGLRVAVNTGEVVATDETEIIGDPVNVAARLQEQGRDGDVVIGESTQRLVAAFVTLAPLGSFSLKGRAEAVLAYLVVSLDRPVGAPAIAFVGRDDELARIAAVYAAALAAPAARLVVLLGSPGLGKSRLLAEFARREGDRATVIAAQCSAAGRATFAPLADALRTLLRIEDGARSDSLPAAIEAALPKSEPERARIASGVAALLSGTPADLEETFFTVRRFIAAVALARPVLLVIDDLQWAEPLLLDLVEHLVQWGSGARLLLLVAARPELRDVRSSLATSGGVVADVVTLAGLDAGAATRLAANVIGAEALPAAIAGRVLAASEGNPLFVTELVRMLVHDGVLRQEGERWTTGVALADLEMPPTIQALLAARIERLRPEERSVLERAAVVGRQFSRSAVAELLPGDASNLDARLEALRRSELIEPDVAWFLGEPGLRFHHGLIRDAAYRRVLKGTRAELHGRFADWVEAKVGDAAPHDETLGWHLERAHQHLGELGPIDARGRAVGERAARYLAAAGRRALARDDVPVAASLLGRALARLDAADPARADLALDWCEALLSAGDVAAAAGAIDELGRFSAESDRLRAWHTCFAGQLAVLTDPQALFGTVDAVAAAAAALASQGDSAGEAKAHSVHAAALARLGKMGPCEAALDRALAAARRVNDRRRQNGVLAGAPLAALWGPSPVTRASGRCLDVVRVLRITQGALAVEAVALNCQGVLEALRGRSEAARRMVASSRHMVEELGITQRLFEADVFAGRIELLEDDAVAAERCLRSAYDGLCGLGLGIDAAEAAALLGRALLAQGRSAEAEALSHESETLAGDDLRAAIAWRGVRAEALARRGEHAAALEFASKAVEIAAATDALLDHADARQALAVALRAMGRSREADAEEARAIELWEAKGATLLALRARDRETRTTQVERAPKARAEAAHPIRRQVRANAATAHAALEDAAFAARDTAALTRLFSDELEVVDHPVGASYGALEYLAGLRRMLSAKDLSRRQEPLTSLGDTLALSRIAVSASGIARGNFDVGAYEYEGVILHEVDAQGRCQRAEIFAADHLAAAIARLYERFAELLPLGPERTRAAATAASVAAIFAFDLRRSPLFADDIEFVDHRSLGLGSAHGAEAAVRRNRALLELADNLTFRVDDVLALRSDVALWHATLSGTDRRSGGPFELAALHLRVFDAAGLQTRVEFFDTDRTTEALARFDELVAAPPTLRPVRRRVRANAATANAARYDAAIAARDDAALDDVYAEVAESVHHPTGAVYDRATAIARSRAVMRAENARYETRPLATLGDSLALGRWRMSAAGLSSGNFDVGAYESEGILLTEVDAHGRRVRLEEFEVDHLGSAIARLYERHAELLPDGPERTRAAATARSVAILLGPFEPDRWAEVVAPAIEFCDPRAVGMGPVHGADALLVGVRALVELTTDWTMRVDSILALRSDALLIRWTNFGTDRASGGSFERNLCQLWIFGADGRLLRWEQSEAEREAEALARFDELVAEPASARRVRRRVRTNAATAHVVDVGAAVAARDADALALLLAEECEVIDHETGATYGRPGILDHYRRLFRTPDLVMSAEPLATLGGSLVLCHYAWSGSGASGRTFDVGAFEFDKIQLVEVDAQGRRQRLEGFAANHLGDAIARLYERHAELLSDGPARVRAAATARSIDALMGPSDSDRYAMAYAPTLEVVDHRTLGTMSARGAEAHLQNLRSWREIASLSALRQDEILGLQSDAFLARQTLLGTDRNGGGDFERQFLMLWIVGTDGLVTRVEYFDTDHDAEALARLDELLAKAPEPRFANAAWRAAERSDRLWMERNGDALIASRAPTYRLDDRRAIVGVTLSGADVLTNQRVLLAARSLQISGALLATRGARLMLRRILMIGEYGAGGPTEYEYLQLMQIDDADRMTVTVLCDLSDLDAAYEELDARYAAGEGGPCVGTLEMMQRSSRAIAARDWEQLASGYAEDFVFEDHRLLGWGTRSRAELAAQVRVMVELAPDVRLRIDHVLAVHPRGTLSVPRWVGSRDGGIFEIPLIGVSVIGTDGRIRRIHTYDAGHLDAASACFDALTADPPAPPADPLRTPPNAASGAPDRLKGGP